MEGESGSNHYSAMKLSWAILSLNPAYLTGLLSKEKNPVGSPGMQVHTKRGGGKKDTSPGTGVRMMASQNPLPVAKQGKEDYNSQDNLGEFSDCLGGRVWG